MLSVIVVALQVICRIGSLEKRLLRLASASTVICRIGSLEIEPYAVGTIDQVICRIGSLEILSFVLRKRKSVICRIGSLESAGRHIERQNVRYLPYRQLRKAVITVMPQSISLSAV